MIKQSPVLLPLY